MNVMDEFHGAITLQDLNRMSVKERKSWIQIIGFRQRRRKLDKMMQESMRSTRR